MSCPGTFPIKPIANTPTTAKLFGSVETSTCRNPSGADSTTRCTPNHTLPCPIFNAVAEANIRRLAIETMIMIALAQVTAHIPPQTTMLKVANADNAIAIGSGIPNEASSNCPIARN